MPTYQARPRFLRDIGELTSEQTAAWERALERFVEGLRAGSFHPSLRIKRVKGYPGVWEMTWAPDGRATFEYGQQLRHGEPHIIWRRIGTHDLFRRP